MLRSCENFVVLDFLLSYLLVSKLMGEIDMRF